MGTLRPVLFMTALILKQALNEHSDHLVNLYESADYVGGHAHTVEFKRTSREAPGLREC
jgi:hypothetical protein